MAKLIRCSEDLASRVAQDGAAAWGSGGDAYIYGGDALVPGYNYALLFDVARYGQLRAVVDISFGRSVKGWSAEVREVVGAALKLAGKIFVPTQFDVDYALHLGINTEIGGRLGWLLSQAGAKELEPTARFVDGILVNVPAFAITRAIQHQPFVLQPLLTPSVNHFTETRLVHFAVQYGLEQFLCYDDAEKEEAIARARDEQNDEFFEGLVERGRAEARRTLESVFEVEARPEDPVERVHFLLSGGDIAITNTRTKERPMKKGLRRLELGSVFDPATHYTEGYYDGTGLEYWNNSAKRWDVYKGPGLVWDGNRLVAKYVRDVLEGEPPRLLDVGCSSGDFVRCARDVGFDASGFDLSDAAIARAVPGVAKHIVRADFTDPIVKHDNYNIVTAWDFWEHIFEVDLDRLIDAVYNLLPPDGLHWCVICTRGEHEQDYVFPRGVTFTEENSWLLASGHVTIKRWGWWMRKFLKHGFRLRPDYAYGFQVRREEDPAFRQVASWTARHLFALEKVQ